MERLEYDLLDPATITTGDRSAELLDDGSIEITCLGARAGGVTALAACSFSNQGTAHQALVLKW